MSGYRAALPSATRRAELLFELFALDQAWRDEALCAQVEPDLWFPEKGGDPKPALKICRHCPVQRECLTYALDANEVHGVWGRTTAVQRARMHGRVA